MREISNDDLKIICKNILKKFTEICKEHDLKYSIFYGTLIGAVRHGGFIPWDDDIDVVMPRKDYEKLLKLQYEDDQYEIKNYRYTKDYFYPFSKMIDKNTVVIEKSRAEKNMGVFIDIFPIDYVDNYNNGFDKDIAKALKNRIFMCHLAGSTDKKYAKSIANYIIKKAAHFIMDPFRLRLIEKFDKEFIKENGEYCINFVNNAEGESQLLKAEYWDNLIAMKFEDIEVMGFADYDAILTKKYGDYMKLPPKDRQATHHSFDSYYRD